MRNELNVGKTYSNENIVNIFKSVFMVKSTGFNTRKKR